MTNGRRDDIFGPMGPSPIRPRIFSGSALLAGVLVVSVLIGGALVGYHRIAAGLPETIDLKSYQPKSASAFYAKDGSGPGAIYRERRFPVTLDAVPKHVQAAFIAAEDARFYSHPGVDPEGILRAFVKDLLSWDFAQGGSTITQQLARSMLLTREKTISRKLREIILALRIERSNSKAQILETYLNEVYLGRGAYGIEAAAHAYFGKKAADLTIGEAAYLGGLVQNPAKYAPEHANIAETRRKYVLAAMLKMKSISKDQYKKALEQKPVFVLNKADHGLGDSSLQKRF
ncbi:MAG: transglycosylase domain-containing protein [Desulfomonilaceae bacterium]